MVVAKRWMVRGTALLLVFALQGCVGALLKLLEARINESFPPVTFEQIKQKTLTESAQGLGLVAKPALLANVPVSTLQEALDAGIKKIPDADITVQSVKLQPDEQGFNIKAHVRYKIPNPHGYADFELSAWVPVSVTGHVAVIRPALRNVKLQDLRLEGWGVGEDIAKLIADDVLRGVNRYMANVNGQIAPLTYALKPSEAGLSPVETDVGLPGGRIIKIPGVQVGNMAVLIDSFGLHLVAELKAELHGAGSIAGLDNEYAHYRAAFLGLAAQVKPHASMTPGVFVSDAFLTSLLGSLFKPVNLDDVAEDARTAVAASLAASDPVAVGASIGSDYLIPFATQQASTALAEFKGAKFDAPNITLSDQAVQITVPMTHVASDSGLTVKGTVGLAAVIAPLADQLRIRVVATDIRIDSVSSNGSGIALNPFVVSVNNVLSQLIPYLNGAFDVVPITVPAPVLPPFKAPSGKGLATTPDPLTPPELGRIGLIPRLTTSGIQVMAMEMAPLPGEFAKRAQANFEISQGQANQQHTRIGIARRSMLTVQVAPSSLDSEFKARWESSLGPYPPLTNASLDGAASMLWVTKFLNRTLSKNSVVLHADLSGPPTSSDSGMLKFGGGIGVNCTPRNCSRNACDLRKCSRNSCSWDCRRCGWLGCFDDPFCKAGEAACNVREEASLGACNVQANAEKALCDAREEAALGACNVQRELEMAGCNILKELANAINDLSSLGSIKVESKVRGGVSFESLELNYDAVTASLGIKTLASGSMHADGSVDYTPAGIGHVLICPIPGKVNFSVNGDVPPQWFATSMTLSGSAGPEGSLVLRGKPASITVKGTVHPAPLDALFLQNPQLLITCTPNLTSTIVLGSLVGKVSAYSPADVLGAIEKAIPGNQEEALRTIKMLTAGIAEQPLDLDPVEFRVPTLPLTIGKTVAVLRPAFVGGHVLYKRE